MAESGRLYKWAEYHTVFNQIKCYQKLSAVTCADPEGGTGGLYPRPLKNHKNIGILSNTDPGPLKNHKAAISQHSIMGHHWHAS